MRTPGGPEPQTRSKEFVRTPGGRAQTGRGARQGAPGRPKGLPSQAKGQPSQPKGAPRPAKGAVFPANSAAFPAQGAISFSQLLRSHGCPCGQKAHSSSIFAMLQTPADTGAGGGVGPHSSGGCGCASLVGPKWSP